MHSVAAVRLLARHVRSLSRRLDASGRAPRTVDAWGSSSKERAARTPRWRSAPAISTAPMIRSRPATPRATGTRTTANSVHSTFASADSDDPRQLSHVSRSVSADPPIPWSDADGDPNRRSQVAVGVDAVEEVIREPDVQLVLDGLQDADRGLHVVQTQRAEVD